MMNDAIPNTTGDVWEYVSSGPDHSEIKNAYFGDPCAWIVESRGPIANFAQVLDPCWSYSRKYRMRRKAQMPVIEEQDINFKIAATRKHSHYFKPCPYKSIDIYRVIDMWEITSPPIQHAIKKLFMPGGRGTKDVEQDLQEAIDSIQRAIEMMREDAR